jgi:hypothetical protein
VLGDDGEGDLTGEESHPREQPAGGLAAVQGEGGRPGPHGVVAVMWPIITRGPDRKIRGYGPALDSAPWADPEDGPSIIRAESYQ